MGSGEKLHNEKLQSLYRSPNIVRVIASRRLRWIGQYGRMQECFKNFNWCNYRKRPLGRPKRRWQHNIRMGFKEMGINTRNWVDSGQVKDYWRTLVNGALNFWVP